MAISIGPVKLEFDGTAEIKERNEADRTLVVDAEGADKKGRGQASLQLNAGLSPTPRGTKVDVALDLQLSGAAAQYGRGMVADVTAVLLDGLRDEHAEPARRDPEGARPRPGRAGQAGERVRHRAAGPADGAGPGLPALLPSLPTPEQLIRRHLSCGHSAT